MWLLFKEAVEALMAGAWDISYRTARVKFRFLLNNRSQIYQEIFKMDESMKRRVPMRIYTSGIEDGEGFFGYVDRIVTNMVK